MYVSWGWHAHLANAFFTFVVEGIRVATTGQTSTGTATLLCRFRVWKFL